MHINNPNQRATLQPARRRLRHATALSVLLFAALFLAADIARAALTLDAVMHHDPARPNEALQLDLTVANTDVFARTGVVIEMEYPAGLDQLFESDFSGDCPSTTCTTGETVTWTLGSIPAGGQITVDVPAVVAGATSSGTVITFSPVVSDDMLDNDADVASVTVDAATRFDLAMGESSDPAAPGQSLSYEITWGYRADSGVVTDSDLEFTLPADTTFVSASDGGSSDGSVVSWPLGPLEPGQSGIREVTVTLDGGLADGAVINASAHLINVDMPGETATARTGTVVASSSGLSLVIESNTNPARQEEDVNFNVIVSNTDPFSRFGVTLTARQPQDTNQVFESEFEGDCPSTTCTAAELISWSLGDLAAGASVSVDLPERITTTAPDGVLVNLFMVLSDDSGLQVKQSDTIRVQDDTLYDVSLSENTDPVVAGSELSYRMHFGHRDDAASISDSTLLFSLPTGASFVSASDSGSHSAGVVTWALGNLDPGQGGIRDVTVLLDGTLPSSSVLETWAEIQSLDTPVERTRAEAATPIASSSSLELTFESNTQPAREDELTRVQLTVTNNDPFTRFGIEIESRMPQDTAQIFESEFEGDCSSTTCTAGERLTWQLGDIPAGGSRSVSFPVEIAPAPIDGVLVNIFATASDDQGVQTRSNDALRIQSDSLYDVALSESSDPAAAGDTLQYLVTFGYRADAGSVNNSRLRLALPPEVAFVEASDGGVVVDGEVRWNLGTLSPGDGGQRRAEVTINGGLDDATVLEAEVILESIASPLEHARARAATVIAASLPLSLRVEANPKPGRPDETANMQIIVANNDPFTHFGVVLEGRFPQNIDQLFETQFDGDCASTTCTSGEIVTWNLGDIVAGEAATAQLPVTLTAADIDGLLVNFYLETTDDQGEEARYVETIRIDGDNPYELGLSENADPASPGDTIQYRVTFGHRADAGMLSDSVLSLVLPAGTTPVSGGFGGVIDGNEITWALGDLNPGDGGVRFATASLDGGLAPASILEARAQVQNQANPLVGKLAEALTVAQTGPPLSLSITSAPNPAHASDELLLQLSVTNNDAVPHFGVTLVSRFPQGVDQLFETEFDGDCPSTACETGELITWQLGDIGAGQTVAVELPPTVSPGVLDGELIDFYAIVSENGGIRSRAVNFVRTGDTEIIIFFKHGFEDSDVP